MVLFLILIAFAKSEIPGFYAKVQRPPHYHYSYEVQDEGAGVNYGQSEVREGAKTKGTFHVNLPYGHYQYLTYQINHDAPAIAPYTPVAHAPPIPLHDPPEANYEVPISKPEFVAPELPPAYRDPPSVPPAYIPPEMAPAYHPPPPQPSYDIDELYMIPFPPIPTYEPPAPENPPYQYLGAPFSPDYGNVLTPDYGAPPAPNYGAPPAPAYNAPPTPDYGVPPVTDYAPPVTPIPNYGVRVVNHGSPVTTTPAPAPVTSYGAPAENYSEPAPDYGPPVVPTTDYQGLRGAPESYGTPQAPPVPTTPSTPVAPGLEPYENFGPPYADFYGKNEMTFNEFAPVTKTPTKLYVTPHPQVQKQVQKPMKFPEKHQEWTPINPYHTPTPPKPYSPSTPLYRHHFQKQNYVENPPYFAPSPPDPIHKRKKVPLYKEYGNLRGKLSGFLGALAVKINKFL